MSVEPRGPTTEENAAIVRAVRDALGPLSRLRLRHSAACPFLFDGDCSCGVAAIERLVEVARSA